MSKLIRDKPTQFKKPQLWTSSAEFKEPELNIILYILGNNDISSLDSDYEQPLKEYGWKLVYCLSDIRKLKHYIPELQIGTYIVELYVDSAEHILGEPNEDGWLCSSKIIVVQNGLVGTTEKIENTHLAGYHTKRIARVVPTD